MSDWIYIEGEGLVYWPMCPIKGCPNRICFSEESKYCYPHTGSGKSFDELIAELNEEPKEVIQWSVLQNPDRW